VDGSTKRFMHVLLFIFRKGECKAESKHIPLAEATGRTHPRGKKKSFTWLWHAFTTRNTTIVFDEGSLFRSSRQFGLW